MLAIFFQSLCDRAERETEEKIVLSWHGYISILEVKGHNWGAYLCLFFQYILEFVFQSLRFGIEREIHVNFYSVPPCLQFYPISDK